MIYHDVYDPLMPADSSSDPSSLLILPLRHGVREAYFKSLERVPDPNSQYVGNYKFNAVTLISKAPNVSSVQLNSASVASRFIAFPNNPNYMYAYILLDTGACHLESDEAITACYYDAYQRGSAAYSIGDICPGSYQDSFRLCVNDTLSCYAASIYRPVFTQDTIRKKQHISNRKRNYNEPFGSISLSE